VVITGSKSPGRRRIQESSRVLRGASDTTWSTRSPTSRASQAGRLARRATSSGVREAGQRPDGRELEEFQHRHVHPERLAEAVLDLHDLE
jgi:hypothetical protein